MKNKGDEKKQKRHRTQKRYTIWLLNILKTWQKVER